jgi:hypothetical protein
MANLKKALTMRSALFKDSGKDKLVNRGFQFYCFRLIPGVLNHVGIVHRFAEWNWKQ